MKKLAVLLPTYNSAIYLNDSIDSILNQTFSDFDFYIYDDCSTDNTKEIILQYNDPRLFYRKNNVNLGISKTLNKGLEELLPRYEFIARMDADDWAFPERLQKQIDFMNKNQHIAMCGTQGYWLKDMSLNSVETWKYALDNSCIRYSLLFLATFGHSSVIFRSYFFYNQNLRYNELIKTCEDWDLWIRVLNKGMVANLPCFLMKYRILNTSNHRSSQNKLAHLKERSIIISNYWKTFDINLSPEQVYEYYYSSDSTIKQNFENKLEILISCFNQLFLNHSKDLESKDKKKFTYMMARRILDFWKRSEVSRFDLIIWKVILKEVNFMNKIKLLKSIIR